jgi:hypothetical protein
MRAVWLRKPGHERPGAARARGRQLAGAAAFLAAVGTALLATTLTARADLRDQLVVHLTFDGKVTDSSGEGNDGVIIRDNGSGFAPGIIGQAFETTGSAANPGHPTGNFITLSTSYADLNFGTSTDFSISFWGMYQTGNQHDDIPWISNKDWNSGGNVGWVLASEPGGTFKWNYAARGESRADSPHVGTANGSLDDGNWHHYAVVVSRAGDVLTYLDGVQVDDTHLGSANEVQYEFTPLPVNIMQDGTGDYTDVGSGANWDDAFIDDLGIWRRALTSDEVQQIYTQGQMGISALGP